MALSKQAKVLSPKQIKTFINHITTTRNPARNRVIALLSIKAGMRVKEISNLTWDMVTDAEGELTDVIAITNTASKGKSSGREIPMNKELKAAISDLFAAAEIQGKRPVVVSEQGNRMNPDVLSNWFRSMYKELSFSGCSSHSGRRTFITNAAKKIALVGGSIRDVQQLAGHVSLAQTQVYIEGDTAAKRNVVNLI